MEVKMLKSERGSRNGFTIEVFESGKSYDLPEDLARAFIKLKSAFELKEEVIEKEVVKNIAVEKKKEEKKEESVKPQDDNAEKEIPEKNEKPKKKFSMKDSVLNDK